MTDPITTHKAKGRAWRDITPPPPSQWYRRQVATMSGTILRIPDLHKVLLLDV